VKDLQIGDVIDCLCCGKSMKVKIIVEDSMGFSNSKDLIKQICCDDCLDKIKTEKD
jgi:hypothetical protein